MIMLDDDFDSLLLGYHRSVLHLFITTLRYHLHPTHDGQRHTQTACHHKTVQHSLAWIRHVLHRQSRRSSPQQRSSLPSLGLFGLSAPMPNPRALTTFMLLFDSVFPLSDVWNQISVVTPHPKLAGAGRKKTLQEGALIVPSHMTRVHA